MNDSSAGSGQAGLQYLLTDHASTSLSTSLGSVVAITDSSGTLTSQQRYLPFGQIRTDLNGPRITQTDFAYTGQRALDMGLMDYKARAYDPLLGRFISPDNIISGGGTQGFNRYTYSSNSPIVFNDPSGHKPCWATKKYTCNNLTQEIADREYAKYSDKSAVAAFFASQGLTISTGGNGASGAVSATACNDVDPACGPNYYYGPVDSLIGSFGSSAGGLSGGIAGSDPLGILGVANYRLLLPPATIFYQNLLIYEHELTWSPSLTLNNGSPLTLSPNSIGFRFGNGPVSNTASFTNDSFQFGYRSSPFIDGWNSISGMSISTPRAFQPWTASITVNDSLRVGKWTLDNAFTYRITARPDQVVIFPGAVYAGFLIYKAALGMRPSQQELCFGTC